MSKQTELEDRKVGKDLYSYQKGAINQIFKLFEEAPDDYHLLYQLPTGGGKTVIFSEIVRQYLKHHNKKVLVMTHRIELCKQTSSVLTEFGVVNKIIDSKAKLDDQNQFSCFVAMVETLNNRLSDDKLDISDIGLVIIDEAHYNSFTKLFKFFSKSFVLGVTATPLSSSIELPMTDNYDELIVGESIESLIENGFLARANMFTYNVGLTSLVVGANGDYTVKSSEDLYTDNDMLSKLLGAYEERCKGKKTLIFNNGINTSLHVYDTFKRAGYPIAHLDNTNTRKERALILRWFKKTPDAILTSVSILTTGFDEPTVESIILNRATKSLTLYYQMIGRGSRILKNKKSFDVIDLGNNFHRFGPWGDNLDWQRIFKSPNYYLDSLLGDEELESNFKYEMPDELRAEFSNSKDLSFNVHETYVNSIRNGESSKVVLERSIAQHAKICVENSEDVYDALALAKMLGDDIDFRINRYTKCISKSTFNFVEWLKDDYRKKLNAYLRANFDEVYESIHGYAPKD
ncbi:MAG: DEAD/DEAH box helicase family protein [Flavobacteriales bacterium]|nr:DEAD/DEAH box helicase family protein [Flavobacteriia bacterium]NCP07173.1 DEAD/DEAH box helicase family protein [Flavobacteriales bacterium]PIV92517.1 MAG: DEAD/DEAH box helicase [Flavobacteriaceae bacterium CG17_big_fil_post_rev_8_21_14_2_50_33_15]PIY09536.1 MAG: DEAD/DEAH box helicase [Flavobacteriaceae bacterium CG_4_10_14_3_um_filter_33_47]PJB17487.1 MAG: DEAD/DEAH box helicase [Flavobacteriaceae bacterium CG_4_9_14_3_um_filter_33_16]